MTFKRAIAIGTLTITAITLGVIGAKRGWFKSKTILPTYAENLSEDILYETNFDSTQIADYKTTNPNHQNINFKGTAQYIQATTNNTTKYQYKYNFTEITTRASENNNNYSTLTPLGQNQYIFTIYSQQYNDPQTNAKLIWTSTVVYDLDEYFVLNFSQTRGINTETITATIDTSNYTITSNQSYPTNYSYFNTQNNNTTEQYIIDMSTGEESEYAQGYNNGYVDGYNQAINEITPDTVSTTYQLQTFNYNKKLNQTYYTATGNFDTYNSLPFNNNESYKFSGTVNITVTAKQYQDNLQNTINGYQTELTVDFVTITNETREITLTQQNHTNSKALIYTASQPNGIGINITSITPTTIILQATLQNSNLLYVTQNFNTPYNGQVITTTTTTPSRPLKICDYDIASNINSITSILQEKTDEAYNEGINVGQSNGEIIPLQDIMLNILSMPFTFISQAFDVTLWPNTQYEFQIGTFIKAMIAISAILFIVKVFTSGFSVMGNFTNNINSKITSKHNKPNKPTKQETPKKSE